MKLPVRISLLLILFFSADLCFSYVQKELRPQTALQDRAIPSALHPLVKQNAELLRTAALKKASPSLSQRVSDQLRNKTNFTVKDVQKRKYRHLRKRRGILPQLRPCDRLRPAKKDGSLIWDMTYDGNRNGTPDWLEVVSIAKTLGFDWGGDWRGFKDYPHLQMIPD